VPTHQSLSGSSDEELLQRMITTHPERFGPPFWDFFSTHVAPALPPQPVAIDLGCGPGLLLRDLAERCPGARLHGYDITPAMIAHAQKLSYASGSPVLAVHDVTTQSLSHGGGSVHLLMVSSMLHVIDEPLPVLAEIKRVLAPKGIFLLHEWVRQPLEGYLAWRRDVMKESPADTRRRGFRLFPVHNKYTTEDWRWLVTEAGFAVRTQTQLRTTHRIFVLGVD
jgi:SAM-dependent methyltransferase